MLIQPDTTLTRVVYQVVWSREFAEQQHQHEYQESAHNNNNARAKSQFKSFPRSSLDGSKQVPVYTHQHTNRKCIAYTMLLLHLDPARSTCSFPSRLSGGTRIPRGGWATVMCWVAVDPLRLPVDEERWRHAEGPMTMIPHART